MPGQQDKPLKDYVRAVIDELDADGGGFQTKEAADRIVFDVCSDGIVLPNGSVRQPVKDLMRAGATVKVKGYVPTRNRIAETLAIQGDFQEVTSEFDHRWLGEPAAMDEGDDAVRKVVLRMTLPEVKRVILLKQLKAAQCTAIAEKLQAIIDTNPHWEDDPSLTVADILGIHE